MEHSGCGDSKREGPERIARNTQFENDGSPVSTIVKGVKRREFGVQRQSRLISTSTSDRAVRGIRIEFLRPYNLAIAEADAIVAVRER
jgi:hypothetical protein